VVVAAAAAVVVVVVVVVVTTLDATGMFAMFTMLHMILVLTRFC
jgi:hypothetical protein